MEAYRIADEPKPGGLSHLTVNPIWPLFGVMFAGTWLAWPWFIFNGIAMGSPTLRKEIAIAIGGFVGATVLIYAIAVLGTQGFLGGNIKYSLLALTVYKLGISYWLYVTQARGFEIYSYFDGIVRNGIVIVFLAAIFGRRILATLSENFDTIVLLVLR